MQESRSVMLNLLLQWDNFCWFQILGTNVGEITASKDKLPHLEEMVLKRTF